VPPQRPALIFDLDGTLTDSKPGIVACLQKALDARGITDHGSLDRFVGPPVEEWTIELMPDASDEARLELGHDYRACYEAEGWKDNSLYPGVPDMLAALHQHGFPMFVCTSKRHAFAERILDLFELTKFFTAIYGDQPHYASHSKVDLLALLLREQSLAAPATPIPWMIGDRSFDIRAARANQIRSLAAAWGYGNSAEWSEADRIAGSPLEVLHCVLGATN
jgi:phosphoglycolate phosphatase